MNTQKRIKSYTRDTLKLDRQYLKQYGIHIPKNARYRLSYDVRQNLIHVECNSWKRRKLYYYGEFVLYTMDYNEETAKYPGYVHVWAYELFKAGRRRKAASRL